MRLPAAALLLASALACRGTRPATGIVVELISEYAIPTEINRLDVEVHSLTSGQQTSRQIPLDPAGTRLPARMLLEPTGTGGGSVRLVARGVLEVAGKDTVVVTRSALVHFVNGRVLHLLLPLRRICAGRTCNVTMTCGDQGACTNDERPTLPDHQPGSPHADAGETTDARPAPRDTAASPDVMTAADTALPDAPPADASPPDATPSPDAGPDTAGAPSGCPPPAECIDFESSAPSEPGSKWQMSATVPGAVEIGVDPAMGFRSRRSLRIRVLRENAEAFLYRQPPTPGARDEYWGRVMVLATDPPASLPASEWRMIQSNGPIPSLPANDSPNYTISVEGPNLLATTDSPSATCQLSGPALPTQRWVCLEWHFKGVGPDMNLIEAFVDGSPTPAVRVANRGGVCQTGPETVWEAPSFDNVLVGYLGGVLPNVKTHDFWFDDLAVSPGPARIGCAP